MRYFCPSAMMSQEQVHAINPRRYSLTVDSFDKAKLWIIVLASNIPI